MLLDELADWMARKGFGRVADFRSMLAVPNGTNQAAYERANYVTALAAANTHYGPW